MSGAAMMDVASNSALDWGWVFAFITGLATIATIAAFVRGELEARRARREREARAEAEKEVQVLRELISRVDAWGYVIEAIAIFGLLKNLHMGQGREVWAMVMGNYSRAHELLGKIKHTASGLSAAQIAELETSIIDVRGWSEDVAYALLDTEQTAVALMNLPRVSYNSRISQIEETLNRIAIQLRRRIGT